MERKTLNGHRVLSLHFPNATGNAYSRSNGPHNRFYVQDIEEPRHTTIGTEESQTYQLFSITVDTLQLPGPNGE